MSEKPTEAEGLPKRWSARRKSEVVLRLLRGEDIGEVSRGIRVPRPELERWRRMSCAWVARRRPAYPLSGGRRNRERGETSFERGKAG